MKRIGLICLSLLLFVGCSYKANENVQTINQINSLMQEGDTYYNESKFEKAYEKYSEVLILDKAFDAARINRALTGLELGKIKEAFIDLEAVSKDGRKENARFFDVYGYYYWKNRNYPEAIEKYTQAIDIKPTTILYANRAKSYYADHQVQNAKTDLAKVLESSEGKSYSNYMLAVEIAFTEEKFEEAEVSIVDLQKVAGDNVAPFAMMAYAKVKQINDNMIEEDRIQVLIEAQALFEQSQGPIADGILLNYQGMYKLVLKEYEEALEILNKAIELDENQGGYFNNRAIARYYLGDNLGAYEDVNNAIKLDNKNGEYYLGRGYILMTNNQKIPASADFKKAVELKPQLIDRIPAEFVDEMKEVKEKINENL